MTTITIVDSLWRHNDNCCYANMRSQGQASCLLTLEFKCHLRYCSSQEVDVSLSHSAVLHYITWTSVGLILWCHIAPPGTRELNINILCRLPFVLNWMDLCWRDKTPMLKTMQLCLFSHFFSLYFTSSFESIEISGWTTPYMHAMFHPHLSYLIMIVWLEWMNNQMLY